MLSRAFGRPRSFAREQVIALIEDSAPSVLAGIGAGQQSFPKGRDRFTPLPAAWSGIPRLERSSNQERIPGGQKRMSTHRSNRGTRYSLHILSEFHRHAWAILPEKFAVIHAFPATEVRRGGSVSAEQIAMVKRPARMHPISLNWAIPTFVAMARFHTKKQTRKTIPPIGTARLRKTAWPSGHRPTDLGTRTRSTGRNIARGSPGTTPTTRRVSVPTSSCTSRDEQRRQAHAGMGRGESRDGRSARSARRIVNSRRRSQRRLRSLGRALQRVRQGTTGVSQRSWRSPQLEAEASATQAGSGSPRTKDGSTIAVLPLAGTISHRMGMLAEASGGISTERFTQLGLRARPRRDPSVKAIVIDALTRRVEPSTGSPELADEIARTNKIKPVVGGRELHGGLGGLTGCSRSARS